MVEAGTFYELSNGNASQVPGPGVNYAGKSALDWQPLIDWGYMTTPQAVSTTHPYSPFQAILIMSRAQTIRLCTMREARRLAAARREMR